MGHNGSYGFMPLPDDGLITSPIVQNINRDPPGTKMILLWIYSVNMITRKR